MEKFKNELSDSIEMKQDAMQQTLEYEINKVQNNFDEVNEDNKKFKEDMREKNKQRIVKIKDICSGFFEKTDKLVTKNSKSVSEIQ